MTMASDPGRPLRDNAMKPARPSRARRAVVIIVGLAVSFGWCQRAAPALAADAPTPLLRKDGEAVDWWFVFKFNSTHFDGCGTDSGTRSCPFGGKVQKYAFSQQFVFASSKNGKLEQGKGCVGGTMTDPVGATFDQVYNGSFNFLIWNDQFYRDPAVKICGNSDGCTGSWGHSKGMLAWNDDGEGFVMQVSTPSWPGSGSKRFPRKSGNTLGCVINNNVKYSQHFFALKLTKDDVVKVVDALANASVVTEPGNAQIVRNGGPREIRDRVDDLGKKSDSTKFIKSELSTGVTLISKPSALNVPPWQMVSALLESEGERSATWWASPQIYSTTKTTKIRCWDDDDLGKPGPVGIATTGQWDGVELGLKGGQNHAKIGVTTSGSKQYAIFGDLNQQGTIAPPKCDRSQNGRGGLFFVVDDKALFESVTDLLDGDTAPSKKPR
jgi:deoxyribonuclease II